MTLVKRLLVVILAVAILGGLLEIALRTFLPSAIESGARMALRVPAGEEVHAELEGSLALNALRWRIADVAVTADGVSLSDDITAATTLDIEAMPLIPAFGSLRDGTATFTIPADQLAGVVRLVSGGLAEWGEMREGELVGGGTLTDQQFDLPHSPAFEIAYEGSVELGVEGGDILVTPTSVAVADSGPVGAFLTDAMSQPRTVCIAQSLPRGVTLTGIEVRPSGEVLLHAALSEGLLSNPADRFPGSCE